MLKGLLLYLRAEPVCFRARKKVERTGMACFLQVTAGSGGASRAVPPRSQCVYRYAMHAHVIHAVAASLSAVSGTARSMVCWQARSFTYLTLEAVLREPPSPRAYRSKRRVRKYLPVVRKGISKVMPTISQLVRKPREVSIIKSKSPRSKTARNAAACAPACTPPPQEAELRSA